MNNIELKLQLFTYTLMVQLKFSLQLITRTTCKVCTIGNARIAIMTTVNTDGQREFLEFFVG